MCASASCHTTEAYANFLKSIPNTKDAAAAFLKFQKRINSVKENGTIWISEQRDALQQFVNSIKSKINYDPIFGIDKNTIAQYVAV